MYPGGGYIYVTDQSLLQEIQAGKFTLEGVYNSVIFIQTFRINNLVKGILQLFATLSLNDQGLWRLYSLWSKFRDFNRNSFLQIALANIAEQEFATLLTALKNIHKLESQAKKATSLMSHILFKNEPDKEEIYLFLGGGDMSYELSFAKKHSNLAKSMYVTIYEDENTFKSKSYYQVAMRNLKEPQELGITVFYGVDATKLHTYTFLKNKCPSHIYFFHPWAGNSRNGELTRVVMKNFFQSASLLQPHGSKIIIPRRKNEASKKPGHYKGMYGFHEFSTDQNFIYKLERKHKFTTKRYPGYNHVTTAQTGKSPFDEGGSLEYVFEKKNTHLSYNSAFEEDSDSETEVSQLEPNDYLEIRNRSGHTLLHLAIQQKKIEATKYLLKYGASVNATDANGQPPLFYVLEIEDKTLLIRFATLLISYGAKCNFRIAGTFLDLRTYATQKNLLSYLETPEKVAQDVSLSEEVRTKSAISEVDSLINSFPTFNLNNNLSSMSTSNEAGQPQISSLRSITQPFIAPASSKLPINKNVPSTSKMTNLPLSTNLPSLSTSVISNALSEKNAASNLPVSTVAGATSAAISSSNSTSSTLPSITSQSSSISSTNILPANTAPHVPINFQSLNNSSNSSSSLLLTTLNSNSTINTSLPKLTLNTNNTNSLFLSSQNVTSTTASLSISNPAPHLISASNLYTSNTTNSSLNKNASSEISSLSVNPSSTCSSPIKAPTPN